MSIEGAIVTILEDDAGVGAICGDRIYAGIAPGTESLPCVVYRKISGNKLHDLDGESGHQQPTVELSCWATTYSGACDLALAVQAALKDWSGTEDSTAIQWITVIGDGDAFEEYPGQDSARRFGRRVDIEVFFDE